MLKKKRRRLKKWVNNEKNAITDAFKRDMCPSERRDCFPENE